MEKQMGRFKKLCWVFQLVLAYALFPQSGIASPWTGTYTDETQTTDYYVHLIKKLTISETANRKFKVRIVIGSYLADDSAKPVILESIATGYYDVVHKGARETLICSFPTAKYKPIVVIRRDSPFEPMLNKSSRFKHLNYSFYEASWSPRFVEGDVYRVEAPR